MEDDGFIPDEVPTPSRAPAADDGFEPDPAPAVAVAPVQRVDTVSDDGFEPDAPAATAPFTTQSSLLPSPDGKPTDLTTMDGFQKEAEAAIGRSLRGAGALLEPLTVPLRYFAGKVGEAVGMEVKNKPLSIYPGSAPDVTFTDVAEFLTEKRYPTQKLMEDIISKGGTAEDAAKAVRNRAIWMFGLGTIADFGLDPTMYITLGPVNKATRAALEAGQDVAKVERATIGLSKPFSGKVVSELTIPPVNKAVGKIRDMANVVYSPFDWRTGDMVLDVGSVAYSKAKSAVPKVASREFADPYIKAKLSPEEKKVLLNVAESTPNLRPELKDVNYGTLPADLDFKKSLNIPEGETLLYQGVRSGNIDGKDGASGWWTTSRERAMEYANKEGAGGRVRVTTQGKFPSSTFTDEFGEPIPLSSKENWGVNNPGTVEVLGEFKVGTKKKGLGEVPLTEAEQKVLGLDRDALAETIRKRLPESIKAEGVDITPARLEVIEEMAMNIKRMNAAAAVEQQAARRLDLARPLNEQMIENYVAHVKEPAVRKALAKQNNPVQALEEATEALAKEADAVLNIPRISTAQPFGKRRELRYDVREANKRLRESEKMKPILKDADIDSFFMEDAYAASYLNLVKKKQSKLDQEFIDLMRDKGFNYVDRDSFSGFQSRVDYDQSKYPKGTKEGEWAENTAAKLQHFLIPQRGNLTKKIETYNRVFRNTALLKPSYYLQNFADAVTKNAIQGVLPSDYLNAAKAWKGTGTVNMGGKVMTGKQLRDILEQYNVVSYGSAAEMASTAMSVGKKATADGVKFPGRGGFKEALDRARMAAAGGENWARAAMFINRLQRGYNPKQALYAVENFHFDFGRTTKNLDTLRLVAPFAQFPVKTLGIAGDLALGRPGIYSQQAAFMDRMDKAINDPVESATLKKLLPEYAQIFNPVPIGDVGHYLSKAGEFIDNKLGGNTWVARAAMMYPKGETNLPTNQAYAKLPVGAEVLNQWALWESQVAKNNGFLSGPLYNAMYTMVTGKDSFTGESYDPNPEQPSYGQRGKAAAYNLATGAFAFPALSSIIKQQLGLIQKDRNITPAAQRLFQGALGGPNGFVEIYNVDRSYMIKKIIMNKILKEQEKKVYSLYARELMNGQANTSAYAGIPATTSREVFQDLLRQRTDMMGANTMMDIYKGPRTIVDRKTGKPLANQELAQAIADMKAIVRDNKELDDAFVETKNEVTEARRAELKERKMTPQQLNEMYRLRDEEESKVQAAPESTPTPVQEAPLEPEEDEDPSMAVEEEDDE